MNRSIVPSMRRRLAGGGALLLVLTSVARAQGPEFRMPANIEAFDLAAIEAAADQKGELEVDDGKLPLGLETAITLALRRNLTLVVQRYERSRSMLSVDEARGIFDFGLQVDTSASEGTSPVTSSLQQTGGADLTSEAQSLNVSASQLTAFGGTAQFQFNNSRQASSNLTDFINPRFDVSLSARFTQPLLRNFGSEVTRRDIVVARTNVAINREDFQIQVETIVQQASDGYWNLVEAGEQLKVAEESLRLAKELHEMNRIQVEVGTLPPLDMVQSEAGVAARQEDIIRLRAQVEDAADELRRLTNLQRGDLWNVEIVPTTSAEAMHQPIDVPAAVEAALGHRPDVGRRRLLNEILDIDARFARNQKKPRLDLVGRFGYTGTGGDVRNRETGEVLFPGDYGDAFQQITDRSFEGWSISATFAYPLQNRTARARSAAADLAVDEGDYQLRELELQVLTEVRSAARAVETAAQRIESAKVASRLARENLNAEQKRYENGMSTSFEVLQIQEDLSEALSREVSAVIAYRRAQTAFYRAIGSLLDEHHVLLSDDAEKAP